MGQGLRVWDAAFYVDIARGGYDAVGTDGLRFFPLFPLLGRALALVPGIDTGLADGRRRERRRRSRSASCSTGWRGSNATTMRSRAARCGSCTCSRPRSCSSWGMPRRRSCCSRHRAVRGRGVRAGGWPPSPASSPARAGPIGLLLVVPLLVEARTASARAHAARHHRPRLRGRGAGARLLRLPVVGFRPDRQLPRPAEDPGRPRATRFDAVPPHERRRRRARLLDR